MYRTFLAIFFLILVASAAYAQPSHYRQITPVGTAVSDAIRCSLRSGGYDVSPVFTEMYREQCLKELEGTGFERAGTRLIRWSAASDCHMKTSVKVFRSDIDRRVRVVVNEIYGGCRAAGHRAGWVVLDAPPKGYTVSVEEVSIDPIHDGDDKNKFLFPSDPPVVTTETIEVRQIDTKSCLPLTGQSRWVISSNEGLEKALDGKATEAECRELFRAFSIDFAKDSLVGVSFPTVHCNVPKSLKVSVTKETSTRRRDNAYVLEARYEDPIGACHAYVTHPVWVLIPKIADGYALEVDARRNSKASEPRKIERKIEWIENEDEQ